MKQTCLLIIGMHRSGTSALTGILHLLDVCLGSGLMEGTSHNEKGYFENDLLFNINENLLVQAGSSWDDMFYNEHILDKNIDTSELRETIFKEFQYSKIFAIKDPRLAYLFPIYETVLKELDIEIKIIIPYRNPVEVANSLNTVHGINNEKGLLLWTHNLLLAEKFSRNYPRVFLGFDDLLRDSGSLVELFSKHLDIDFTREFKKNIKDIEEFLESGLKHYNLPLDNISDNLPTITKKIYSLNVKFNNQGIIGEFDVLRKEFLSCQKLFYNQEIIDSINHCKNIEALLKVREQSLLESTNHCKNVEAQLEGSINHCKNVEAQLEGSINHCKNVEAEAATLREQLESILKSKLWKLTTPLRWILRAIKNY